MSRAHRLALVSLHDVTPAHGERVFEAIAHLRGLGVDALNLLVVPDFHHRAHLARLPEFCQRLRSVLGPRDEIALHGFWHLAAQGPAPMQRRLVSSVLTAGEGEFHDLDYAEARGRIEDGLEVLEHAIGWRPQGFVAPAWLQNAEVRRAARDAGLAWCEDHLRIHWLARDCTLLAPALSMASRSLGRRLGSLAFAAVAGRALPVGRVVRLAVHPNDYRHRSLVAALERVARRWLPTHPAHPYREALECTLES